MISVGGLISYTLEHISHVEVEVGVARPVCFPWHRCVLVGIMRLVAGALQSVARRGDRKIVAHPVIRPSFAGEENKDVVTQCV